ncbi:MAG TPA: glycosyltransferase family 4 protein [Flavitalea sp.]|nr:glycosyltransferase family 4 protein [Flavitalea sp.]
MLNKKLLIFTDWYLPGFKAGGPIQSCRNLVEALDQDYSIYVFTSDRDLGDAGPYPEIETDKWTRLGSIWIFYASPKSWSMQEIKRQVVFVEPDIIHLNSAFSLNFTIKPLILFWQKKFSGKLILSPRGMLQAGALKYKPIKKRLFLDLLRLSGLPAKIHFHATDSKEVADIKKHFPRNASIHLAENFPNFSMPVLRSIVKTPGQLELLYLARISPIKNLSFVLELLMKCQGTGKIRFTIAGKVEDERYWQKCAELIRSLPGNVEVVIHGTVEHAEVLNFLQSFHYYILPTFGENFGHGIFEALLAARPVIISDQTPWRGLESKGLGWDIPLDQPGAFIQVISHAIDLDQSEFDQLSARCHQFALDYRTNNETRNKYIELYG